MLNHSPTILNWIGVINIAKRESKFNVSKDKTPRTFEGIIYDSVLEMEYYINFIIPKLLSGEIIDFKRQVAYELQPAFVYKGKKQQSITYISDFDITYSDGSFIVVDCKGMVKPMDSLKKKMFHYKYPELEIVWIGKSLIDGGFVPLEVISKGRKKRKKEKKLKDSK